MNQLCNKMINLIFIHKKGLDLVIEMHLKILLILEILILKDNHNMKKEMKLLINVIQLIITNNNQINYIEQNKYMHQI